MYKKSLNILVTGATGGIGSALCRRLIQSGHRLYLSGRDPARLQELADQLEMPYLAGDLTRSEFARELIDTASGQFETLHAVAHCTGSVLLKPGHRTSDEEWRDILETNLSSAFYLLREAVQKMQQNGGSIVLMSSAAAQHGLPNHEAIAAAKGGIIGLALSASATYAKRNIRVNCVAPGLTRTPMTQSITENEAMLKGSTAMHALGRIGEPDEIASAIHLLLEHEWITGQVLAVDGGLSSVFTRAA